MNLKSALCSLVLVFINCYAFSYQENRMSDQVEILSKLTGQEAIKPVVVLKDRFSQESREIAAQ